MSRVMRGRGLVAACWKVLREDSTLLLFPLCGMVSCLLILASFAVPLLATNDWMPPPQDATITRQATYCGVLFLFYFCCYFAAIFFNAGLVACATMRMEGRSATVSDGLRLAVARLPVIAGWALVSGTVGLLLRVIEDRSEWVGKLVAGLLGSAWTVASFLVVPILVVENRNPIAALADSTTLLKRTWGEQLVGNIHLEVNLVLLSIPGVLLFVLGLSAHQPILAGLGILCLLLVGLVQSALQTIFQAAIYIYARDGKVPGGFQRELLGGALKS